ncbi:MAG: class F sortase [Roseiflexaceae bacterium]
MRRSITVVPLLFLCLATLASTVLSPTAFAAPAAAPEVQNAPTAIPTITPTPVPADPVRLVIPSIKLDRSLVSVGLDKNRIPIVPDHDIGWYNLSAKPGQGENVVLWGHVLRFRQTPKIPAPFADLKKAKVGAVVTLYDANGVQYDYTITQQIWVKPDQVEYILPIGSERITMVSCIGDKVVRGREVIEMTHRLITIAEPVR